MKLELLDIRSLPGIHPGFRIDQFAQGANFITGPNASGKSSTIRALRYLLSPPHAGDPASLNLLARFEADGQQWQVRREGSRIEWEIDGQPGERPSLPDGSALSTWLVTVEDLFQIESGNERHLADQLRRELHQGFDLTVLRDGRYQVQPRIGNAEQRTLRQKLDSLRDVEADQREVSADERRLPQLDEQIRQAQAAAREVRQLEAALELVDASLEASELEARLSSFPEGMHKLLGNESERLEELEEHAERLQASLNEQRHSQQRARDALEASGLSDGRPQEEELTSQQGNINRLETVEVQLEEARGAVADAEVALNNARSRLQIADADSERMPELDADKLGEAQELATELEEQEARKRQFERQIAEADEAVDEHTIDRHQRAISTLRDWLSTAGSISPDLKLPAALGVGGVIAAASGGLTGTGWLALAGAALMSLAIVMLWLGTRQSTDNPRARAASQLKAQGIDGPPNWSRNSVQQYLGDLERELATLRLAVERHNRVTDIRSELQHVEEELRRLQERRLELADRIGFDPTLTTRAMAQFLRDLEAFHKARLDRERTRERVKRLESQRAELQTEVQTLLGQWLDVEDAIHERTGDLAASLRRLQERCRQAREAEGQLERADGEIKRLEQERGQAGEKIEKLYRNAGLDPEQRQELQERLRRLDEWRELKQTLRSVQNTITVKCDALDERPDLLEKARAEEAEALQAELEQARGRADRLGDLRQEKGRVESNVDRTGKDHAREKALAEVAQARDKLETIRTGVIDAQLAHFLLDEIESEHRKESEPPLLEAARESFKAFTHHQWELEFIENDEIGFQARDTALGERRNLTELSTATRMQLLLALRMGQIQLREQSGPTLPLIVDEALTTSDHERASVIMQNLQELADEQGRQVIYLAAGDHEYRLWEHATGKPPCLIDLAEIRNNGPAGLIPAFDLPERPSFPDPDGMNAAEYAQQLQVPALDPRDPAGSAHVFHLLPDRLDRLHQLMDRWRIKRLGQLQSLLESDVARHCIPDDAERELLDQRCRIIFDWIDTWRLGRGKLLDRAALENAVGDGGLTGTTLDGVTDKASDVDWDAERLLEALHSDPIRMASGVERRVAGRQLASFADYLTSEGFLSKREPFDADGRRQRLLSQLGGQIAIEVIHEQVDWLESNSHQ